MSDQVNKNKAISSREYVFPEYKTLTFNCPHCNIYIHQNWFAICIDNIESIIRKFESWLQEYCQLCKLDNHQINSNHIVKSLIEVYYENSYIDNSYVAFCDHCNKYSIWVNEQIVYPDSPTAPLPVEDMPDSVKKLYNEARDIVNKSPRGACALLRLAIQLLIKELGENENNLNKAIGNLVQKGLPEKIQEALDSVRVIGNNAVHPEKINIQDKPEIADTLFKLVNIICERMITANKQIEEIYNTLPDTTKTSIQKRDNIVNNNKRQ